VNQPFHTGLTIRRIAAVLTMKYSISETLHPDEDAGLVPRSWLFFPAGFQNMRFCEMYVHVASLASEFLLPMYYHRFACPSLKGPVYCQFGIPRPRTSSTHERTPKFRSVRPQRTSLLCGSLTDLSGAYRHPFHALSISYELCKNPSHLEFVADYSRQYAPFPFGL